MFRKKGRKRIGKEGKRGGNLQIKNITLKNGAVFIADVHYKSGDINFLNFLKDLDKNPPSQLFLLGDIFHLLLPFEFLIEYNKEVINLIGSVAKKSEVYYTYGNHDFLLDKIFENIIFADIFVDKKKSIYITHGDLNNKILMYNFYVKFIRNKSVLDVLNLLSFNFLNGWVFKKILKKDIKCNKISNFKEIIMKKIADIDYNMIIEGHFHQNVFLQLSGREYYNLGAFYCDRSYYIYKDHKLKELKYG